MPANFLGTFIYHFIELKAMAIEPILTILGPTLGFGFNFISFRFRPSMYNLSRSNIQGMTYVSV